MTTTIFYPTSDSGTYDQGVCSAGVDAYAMVDDPWDAPDDDTTYFTLAAGSKRQGLLFDVSALPADCKIRHVGITTRLKRASGGGSHHIKLYYDAALSLISRQVLSGAYGTDSHPLYFAPGESDWMTRAQLAGLEVVIENNSGTDVETVTQVYITVEYDSVTVAVEGSYETTETLTVENNSASELPSGYSVLAEFTGDDAAAIFNGSEEGGDDVRITYENGGSTQLHRELEEFLVGSVKIWFKTQAAIAGSGEDSDYRIHYGKVGCDTPPAGRTFIFAFPSQNANQEYILELSGDVLCLAISHFYKEVEVVDGDSFQAVTSGFVPRGDVVGGTMRCLEDTGQAWAGGGGPKIIVAARKLGTNTLYMWLRGYGVGLGGDTYFPLINAVEGSYHDLPSDNWGWMKASISIATEATHEFGCTAREDGVVMDELLLTENNALTIAIAHPYDNKLSVIRVVQDVEPTVSRGEGDGGPSAIAPPVGAQII